MCLCVTEMLIFSNVMRKTQSLPFIPEMTMGEYMRRVIAPALELRIEAKLPDSPTNKNWTVKVRVQEYDMVGGRERPLVTFTGENCHMRLGDLIRDGTWLVYTFVDVEGVEGNAGTEPVENTCSICLRPSLSTEPVFRTTCGHDFHCKCLEQYERGHRQTAREFTRCPMCRSVFSNSERDAWKRCGESLHVTKY